MTIKKNERAVQEIRTMMDAEPDTWFTTTSIMKIREENQLPYLTDDAVRIAFRYLMAEGYIEMMPTGYTTQSKPKHQYRKRGTV